MYHWNCYIKNVKHSITMKDGSEIIGKIHFDKAKVLITSKDNEDPVELSVPKNWWDAIQTLACWHRTDLNFTLKTGCIVYTFSKFLYIVLNFWQKFSLLWKERIWLNMGQGITIFCLNFDNWINQLLANMSSNFWSFLFIRVLNVFW